MVDEQQHDRLDFEIRRHIYDQLLNGHAAPTIAATADALSVEPSAVRAGFERLAQARNLVLQEGSREIMMAQPFSAVPTPFHVEADGHRWWGPCIWDALGILAMVKQDGRVLTACGDCGEAMTLTIIEGALAEGEGIIHFGLPAKHWWDNIVFT
jgi:hypothetical protein